MSYGDGGFYFTGPVNGDYGDGGFYFTGPVNGDYSGAFVSSGDSASFHASRGIGRAARRGKASYGAATGRLGWQGSGDYQYMIEPSGKITITSEPSGKYNGKTITPTDGEAYDAVVREAQGILKGDTLATFNSYVVSGRARYPVKAPSASTSSASSTVDKVPKSADEKGGVLTYVAIGGAAVAVLGIGYFAWSSFASRRSVPREDEATTAAGRAWLAAGKK
jgi:hypothetical protein